MIRRIDIENFGSFRGFLWNSSMRDASGDSPTFARMNLIYGRNYTGKTTLSKIFRALETARLPNHYENPRFAVETESETYSDQNLSSHGMEIRVFNSDFVREHLSFLVDPEEGDIQPFAIVGSENREIQEQIEGVTQRLGSIESGAGLYHQHAEETKRLDEAKKSHRRAMDRYLDSLTRFASDKIRSDTATYGKPNYDRRSLAADIKAVRDKHLQLLKGADVEEKLSLLHEQVLPPVREQANFESQFAALRDRTRDLLVTEIGADAPIADLVDNPVLQTWVREGIDLHRNKRATCGFCRQLLPPTFWNEIDAHFNEAAKQLENDIDHHVKRIQQEVTRLDTITPVKSSDFYVTESARYERYRSLLDSATTAYRSQLEQMIDALSERKRDLFSRKPVPVLKDWSHRIGRVVELINALIKINDRKTRTLSQDKEAARNALRKNAVVRFISDSGMDADEQEIQNLAKKESEQTDVQSALADRIEALEDKLRNLQSKQSDESYAAERVNQYLTNHFGHRSLRLVAVEENDSRGVKFRILRGDSPAYNLSEGEKGLIAFCYFVARLDHGDGQRENEVIYIDDPVSSFDSSHIFFLFSLLESAITRPQRTPNQPNRWRYRQIFISTHSLEFLKYMKRLSQPTKKVEGSSKKSKDVSYFIVEYDGSSSKVGPMPNYLQNYITEFVYLFHQIYRCRSGQDSSSPERFFDFGNNLRKFLEAFLFYKYPHQEDSNDSVERIRKYFEDSELTTALINRVTNELSHLGEMPDRGMQPIDIPEISKVADFVLEKMRDKDEEQFNSLVQCIAGMD